VKAAHTPITNRGGFSLIESLLATAMLSLATVSIISPINASYEQQQYSHEMTRSSSLANDLMDEIACRPFVDPNQPLGGLGPEPGEVSRNLFDNIDDYHGYTDSTSDLKSISGATVESSTGGVYIRSVAMVYRASPNGAAGSGDFIEATVSVRTPSGTTHTIRRWFSRYNRK
jgi:type II secretory pathway pseudopilin PulG